MQFFSLPKKKKRKLLGISKTDQLTAPNGLNITLRNLFDVYDLKKHSSKKKNR